MSERLQITPETKVAELIKQYPELEDTLIGMAPPFKKLKNPLLRKSVAKVASLKQAAAVAKIPVGQMVNDLRAAVGQDVIPTEDIVPDESYYSRKPDWFDEKRVVESMVEDDLDEDVMPLNPLIRRANKLRDGEIVELVTTYLPAPGVDIMREKGFVAWPVEDGESIKTYFAKPAR